MEYRPLSIAREEIRLIVLTPNKDPRQPIECDILQLSLAETGQYVALSYCWGDPKDTVRIVVSEREVMVTKTLAHALQELRRRNIYQVWVDAICINQKDFEERAQQVSRMGPIYRCASATMAWLGYSSVDTLSTKACELLDSLAAVPVENQTHQTQKTKQNTNNRPLKEKKGESSANMPIPPSETPLSKRENWDALQDVFKRRYWSRTWIIQEVAVAGNVHFFWNGGSISILKLSRAVSRCKAIASRGLSEPGALSAKRLISMAEFEHIDRLLEFRRFRRSPIRLVQALILSRRAESSEPRDKLYALIHLATDGADTIPFPDYESELLVLNQKTAARMLKFAYVDLDAIVFPLHVEGTWVPQWHDPLTWIDNRLNRYLEGKSKFVKERSSGSSGSSEIIQRWSATPSSGMYHKVTPAGLQVRFKRIGRINQCSATDQEAKFGELDTVDPIKRERLFGKQRKCLIALCWLLHDLIPNNNYVKPKNVDKEDIYRLFGSDAAQKKIQKDVPGFYRWVFCRKNLDFKINGIRLAKWLCVENRNKNDTVRKAKRCHSAVSMGMRLVTTEEGDIGWATRSCLVGDEIFLLHGCSVPVVLRKRFQGYLLVGDSIVHGFMDRQGVQDDPPLAWDTLTLI